MELPVIHSFTFSLLHPFTISLSILPLLGKRVVKIHPKLEIEPGFFPIAISG
jgi:hypothetical protein